MGRRPGGMGCPGSVVTDLRLTASQPPLLPPPSLTTASSNRITSQLGTVPRPQSSKQQPDSQGSGQNN